MLTPTGVKRACRQLAGWNDEIRNEPEPSRPVKLRAYTRTAYGYHCTWGWVRMWRRRKADRSHMHVLGSGNCAKECGLCDWADRGRVDVVKRRCRCAAGLAELCLCLNPSIGQHLDPIPALHPTHRPSPTLAPSYAAPTHPSAHARGIEGDGGTAAEVAEDLAGWLKLIELEDCKRLPCAPRAPPLTSTAPPVLLCRVHGVRAARIQLVRVGGGV